MNIIFIDPPSIMGICRENELFQAASPSMGILYIAPYLKQKTDANVVVLDMGANSVQFTDFSCLIKKNKPSIVAISCKTFNILSTCRIANIVKKISPESIVIVGGAHSTALPEYTLCECQNIDAVVILHEGEKTVLDLYKRMKNFSPLNNDEIFIDMLGIVYRDRMGQIIHNKERGSVDELASLAFPDLSLIGNMP
ncbi:MAG: hypothetical protein D3924_03490 [Candidatus Electrothrix sp. AR4]|nr:hypothetical protein [Candidatus Electrothrix sp. AR4]